VGGCMNDRTPLLLALAAFALAGLVFWLLLRSL
jgi:hypothetical protein